ncbi:hypothetical protein [Lebetimonas natsushimae]|uniref:hypothetical protein n=1 Tax=Lebetimonas natsushimae TaxID=1936991 RepID=UPI0015526E30|nr:hypothetical protein [Lebetimonas natsushimae]
MCMPRIFCGKKLVDGKVENKKNRKNQCDNKKFNKKYINQASVEFENEDTYKRD